MGELITATEAAKRLGVSRTVLYRLIERGLIKQQRVGPYMVINSDELNNENLKNRKNGRPSKKTIDSS